MKIYILGQSGSGKTFFAKELAHTYKIDHTEMDDVYKSAKYDLDTFYLKLNKFVDQNDSWVIDGKYKKIRERLIIEADEVFYLDLPFTRSIYENLKREYYNNKAVSKKFLTHLRKVVKEFYPTKRKIYQELKLANGKVTVFKDRNSVNSYLKNLQKKMLQD